MQFYIICKDFYKILQNEIKLRDNGVVGDKIRKSSGFFFDKTNLKKSSGTKIPLNISEKKPPSELFL